MVSVYCLLLTGDLWFLCTAIFLGVYGSFVLPPSFEWFLYCLLPLVDLWFLCTAFLLFLRSMVSVHFLILLECSELTSSSLGSMFSMYCLLGFYVLHFLLSGFCTGFLFLGTYCFVYFPLLLEWFQFCLLPGDLWFLCMYCLLILGVFWFLCTSFFILSGFCTSFFFLGINGFYVLPSYSWVSLVYVYFLLLLEWFLYCLLHPRDLWFLCTVFLFLGFSGFCVLPSSSWVVSVLPSYSWRSMFSVNFLRLLEWFLYCLLLPGDQWFLCTAFLFVGIFGLCVLPSTPFEWFLFCLLLPGNLWFLYTALIHRDQWFLCTSFFFLSSFCTFFVLPSWFLCTSFFFLSGFFPVFFFLGIYCMVSTYCLPILGGLRFLYTSFFFLSSFYTAFFFLRSFCIASFLPGESPSWGALIFIYCLILLLFVVFLFTAFIFLSVLCFLLSSSSFLSPVTGL